MITFTCPHCGEELNVPEANAGKKGKCPSCKNVVQIPTGDDPPAAAYTEQRASPAPAAFEDDYDDQPRRRRPAAGPALPPGTVMEFAVLAMVLAVVSSFINLDIIFFRAFNVILGVLVGLIRLGLASFGLVLAIFAMMKVVGERAPGFWYALVAIVLSGVAILLNLIVFILAFTMSGNVRPPF